IFVWPNVSDDVQVTRRCSEHSTLAFAGNANAGSSIHARRYTHLHILSFWYRAFAFAQRARRAAPPTAAAVWTFLREPQTTTGPLHLTAAFASRANHNGATDIASAVAARTLLRTINGKVSREPLNRLFEGKRKRHLDISPTLRLRARRLLFFRAAPK